MWKEKELLLLGLLWTLGKCVSDCQQGFSKTQKGCVDTDECAELPELCGKHAKCLNTNGSFLCQCLPGFADIKGQTDFSGVEGQCIDINECLANRKICGDKAYCANLIGSYKCTCNFGYINASTNDGDCIDLDECKEPRREEGDICGTKGSCKNTNGSYWCECPEGYTNYGNERMQCSELECETFKANSAATQNLRGLADILFMMRNSCLALSDPSATGDGRADGDALLEKLFTATEAILSSIPPDGSDDAYGLLSTVENSIRLIGPQLKGNRTRMETTETKAEIVLQRGNEPPTGPIHLTSENATLDTDWTTAAGTGTYPGFALAALLSYRNLERSVNQSFDELQQHEKSSVKPSIQIFSRVVSVVVSNPSTENLSRPVNITLRHLQDPIVPSDMTLRFICAFWNDQGAWSEYGCYQQRSNATHTVCTCEHLSSFAVLMALYPIEHTFGLLLITKIGISISLLCLVLSILTFMFCRSIQGTRTTIHLHLCICLFMADLIFLAGISRIKPESGCTLVAVMLHLFFLGVFAWMLLEGVQLYRMVVLVFNATIRPLYLYTVGYGTPLVIVIISAIIRSEGYGTDKHCWLSRKHGFIWSFFGPVCFIILLNVFFFIVTVWKLAQKFTSLNPDLSKLNKIKAFTVTAIAQMCILGLMWVFGTFLFEENIVAAYIFTLLNSLQGALVFIMHCLLSKQVRDEYARFLSCVCTPQRKRYSDFSSTNPSSSQSQGSRSGQHTGESQI